MFVSAFIALLPYALSVIPIMLVVAIAIAAAGYFRGTAGAKVAATAIWVIAFVLQTINSFAEWAPIRSLFIVGFVTTVSVALIYLPMSLNGGRDWAKGRLVWGILGAMLAAVVHLPLTLTLVCTMGVDCL